MSFGSFRVDGIETCQAASAPDAAGEAWPGPVGATSALVPRLGPPPLCIYPSIYVLIHMYIYICIFYIYLCVYVYLSLYVHIYTCIYIYMLRFICTGECSIYIFLGASMVKWICSHHSHSHPLQQFTRQPVSERSLASSCHLSSFPPLDLGALKWSSLCRQNAACLVRWRDIDHDILPAWLWSEPFLLYVWAHQVTQIPPHVPKMI